MSDHAKTLEIILRTHLIAIIRLQSERGLAESVRALAEGGFRAIEITMNTPGAIHAIAEARAALGEGYAIGAGTVLTTAEVRRAANAGAQFIVSPDTQANVIRAAGDAGLVSIPGALTPTEVAAARRHGADLIKLFPASLFGPSYLKELLAPLNWLRLVPTGGVRIDNIAAYLDSGAAALAVGSSLVNQKTVDACDWNAVTTAARAYTAAIEEYDRERTHRDTGLGA